MKGTSSVKHWDSVRDLVGGDPPTGDDVPTRISGEQLGTAAQVREFLASLESASTDVRLKKLAESEAAE